MAIASELSNCSRRKPVVLSAAEIALLPAVDR